MIFLESLETRVNMLQSDNTLGFIYTSIALVAATLFAWFIISAWTSPLRNYPGLFLSSEQLSMIMPMIWRLIRKPFRVY